MRQLLIYGLITAVLAAVSPCRGDDTSAARVEFERGLALVAEASYEEALGAFRESYRLRKKPGVLYNIAMCQKALHRYIESVRTFQQYLEESGPDAQPDLRREELRRDAEAALIELKELIGRVAIDEAPHGAAVYVDGALAGTMPLDDPLLVDPGRHTVRIVLRGYEELQIDIVAESGSQVRVRAALSPLENEENQPPAIKKAPEPTKTPVSTTNTSEHGPSGLLIGGLVSAGLGLVAAGFGAYFSVQWRRDMDAGKRAANDWNDTHEPQYKILYYNKADDIENDRKGIAAGFIVSGVLLTSGTVLLIKHATKNREPTGGSLAVKPTLNGIGFSF